MREKELVNRALETNIKIYPLSSYLMKNQYETQPIIVLGFGGIPEDELTEAIGHLLRDRTI
ncbi:hypothetical protein [Virgibacillus dakarensis]|uniref:hypothetical protein n=1 Tax=Virgibacillus dakarensis TaxID=1917889 RepID=UPI000B44B963|nr:hypothetical protein [Virgibacillus dakarensis]